jgi:hypothetical protein
MLVRHSLYALCALGFLCAGSNLDQAYAEPKQNNEKRMHKPIGVVKEWGETTPNLRASRPKHGVATRHMRSQSKTATVKSGRIIIKSHGGTASRTSNGVRNFRH